MEFVAEYTTAATTVLEVTASPSEFVEVTTSTALAVAEAVDATWVMSVEPIEFVVVVC